jgi:hypothetical protein
MITIDWNWCPRSAGIRKLGCPRLLPSYGCAARSRLRVSRPGSMCCATEDGTWETRHRTEMSGYAGWPHQASGRRRRAGMWSRAMWCGQRMAPRHVHLPAPCGCRRWGPGRVAVEWSGPSGREGRGEAGCRGDRQPSQRFRRSCRGRRPDCGDADRWRARRDRGRTLPRCAGRLAGRGTARAGAKRAGAPNPRARPAPRTRAAP